MGQLITDNNCIRLAISEKHALWGCVSSFSGNLGHPADDNQFRSRRRAQYALSLQGLPDNPGVQLTLNGPGSQYLLGEDDAAVIGFTSVIALTAQRWSTLRQPGFTLALEIAHGAISASHGSTPLLSGPEADPQGCDSVCVGVSVLAARIAGSCGDGVLLDTASSGSGPGPAPYPPSEGH